MRQVPYAETIGWDLRVNG